MLRKNMQMKSGMKRWVRWRVRFKDEGDPKMHQAKSAENPFRGGGGIQKLKLLRMSWNILVWKFWNLMKFWNSKQCQNMRTNNWLSIRRHHTKKKSNSALDRRSDQKQNLVNEHIYFGGIQTRVFSAKCPQQRWGGKVKGNNFLLDRSHSMHVVYY